MVRHPAVEYRLLLARLIPPIPALFIAMLAMEVLGGARPDLAPAFGISLVGSVMFGFPAMFVLGLPSHLLLKRAHLSWIVGYLVLGAVSGVVTILMMSLIDNRFYDFLVVPGLIAGAVSAALFWLIRRPDRDEPPSSSRTREA